MNSGFVQIGNDKQILNQGCYTAYYAMRELGYDIKLFENANEILINDENFKKSKVIVGGINSLRSIMKSLGISQPEIHSPHKHLSQFINRDIQETTLKEIRNQKFKLPFFIKPLVGDKTFTGFVVKHPTSDLIRLRNFPEETPILLSSVVNFISEYRNFVLDKILIGSKNYYGDFTKIPDFNIIKDAVSSYKDQPSAYSLDFGITDTGETILIEINDGFGIAPYGLEPTLYLNFLTARWQELLKKAKPAFV